MKENNKAISEAFFKKESYADKLKRKLPQYQPQDVRDEDRQGFGSIMSPTQNGLAVTDPREAGKRVVSALGASIGVNSVRNMASRSIKSFPIVISENVDPETSVMLKRVLEEQYAEYMSLLISNQVVDITSFQTGEKEGNIAIQALSSVSSEDEAKMLARKVAAGEVEPEDFLRNLTAYNLVRNEGKEYRSGNKTLDTLLEGAVIVPSSEARGIIEFMVNYSDEIVSLNEATDDEKKNEDNREESNNSNNKKSGEKGERKTLKDFLRDDLSLSPAEAEKRLNVINKLRGFKADGTAKQPGMRTPGSFNRMMSPEIFLDNGEVQDTINSSLGEILLNPRNAAIRDRFEKASFLLQANRIAGVEWIEYVTKRLGIPVSRQVRQRVVREYMIADVIDPNNPIRRISRRDINRIAQNRRTTERTLLDILTTEGRTILTAALTLAAVGGGTAAASAIAGGGLAGTGAALSGAGAAASSWFTSLAATLGIGATNILGNSLLLGTVVGVPAAAIAGIVSAILYARSKRIQKYSRIQGWERVEALILEMEEQQKSVRKLSVVDEVRPEYEKSFKSATDFVEDNAIATSAEIDKALGDYHDYLGALMGKAKPRPSSVNEDYSPIEFTQAEMAEMLEETQQFVKVALDENKEHEALVLSEALISTDMPIELVATQKYEYDTKKAPDVLVVPKFTTRSQYAYGSTEYEKKDLKDRKYNAPLLMTIKFKERFDDGKFSDNELTAVIGILGVITRVPSKEMEYILSSNAENRTVRGILEPDGDPAEMISNIIGINKIKKDVDSLPISKDVWQNLERVSRLAVANSLAGRKNDNIANAHIVFAQKEIDNVRADMSVDYLKDISLVKSLLKRYSAFTIMVANDVSERLFIFDSPSNVNWDVVPYSSFRNKDSGDQLNAMLSKMSSGRL
jgi:hypothetical protein